MTNQDILKKIDQAEALDFGAVFNSCINLFKKVWLQGLLLMIFQFLIMLPLILIIYVPIVVMAIKEGSLGENNPEALGGMIGANWFFIVPFVVLVFLAIIVLSFALQAGFYRVVKKVDFNQPVQTSTFFYFFKVKYLSKLLGVSVSITLIAIVATLCFVLPLFYVIIPISFLGLIFAFHDSKTTSDLLNISFKLGTKKWLLAFGLFMVSFIIYSVINIVSCGIGSLVVKSFLVLPFYSIYKAVIGFDDVDEIQEIGKF